MAHLKLKLVLVGVFLLWKCINGLPLEEDSNLNKTVNNLEEGLTSSENNVPEVLIVSIIEYTEPCDYEDVSSTMKPTMLNESTNETIEELSIEAKPTMGYEEASQMSFQISRVYEVTRHIRLSIDICFLFGIVILIEGVHLFCLDYLICLARTRFADHKRFNFYSTLNMILAFFISFLNAMLVFLFYKSIDYCN